MVLMACWMNACLSIQVNRALSSPSFSFRITKSFFLFSNLRLINHQRQSILSLFALSYPCSFFPFLVFLIFSLPSSYVPPTPFDAWFHWWFFTAALFLLQLVVLFFNKGEMINFLFFDFILILISFFFVISNLYSFFMPTKHIGWRDHHPILWATHPLHLFSCIFSLAFWVSILTFAHFQAGRKKEDYFQT